MKKLKYVLICIGTIIIVSTLSSCSFPSFLKTNKKAGLQVNSNPKATIFLDEEHIGQTPFFKEDLKSGEYKIKLVPENDEKNLTWQGIVKLSPGILTVVDRNLGEKEEFSSGYVLTLEPIPEKDKIKASIISTPDNVVVSLNGEPKGFTPLSLNDIPEGEHLVTVSSPGFKKQTIKAKTVKGYNLVINVQLAKGNEEQEQKNNNEKEKEATEEAEKKEQKTQPPPSSSPESKLIDETNEASDEAETMEKPYVEIKNTPTGWLNVRSEPSTAKGLETVVTKINPGEKYPFVEENEVGWIKIEYQQGEEGWISGQYAIVKR